MQRGKEINAKPYLATTRKVEEQHGMDKMNGELFQLFLSPEGRGIKKVKKVPRLVWVGEVVISRSNGTRNDTSVESLVIQAL